LIYGLFFLVFLLLTVQTILLVDALSPPPRSSIIFPSTTYLSVFRSLMPCACLGRPNIILCFFGFLFSSLPLKWACSSDFLVFFLVFFSPAPRPKRSAVDLFSLYGSYTCIEQLSVPQSAVPVYHSPFMGSFRAPLSFPLLSSSVIFLFPPSFDHYGLTSPPCPRRFMWDWSLSAAVYFYSFDRHKAPSLFSLSFPYLLFWVCY